LKIKGKKTNIFTDIVWGNFNNLRGFPNTLQPFVYSGNSALWASSEELKIEFFLKIENCDSPSTSFDNRLLLHDYSQLFVVSDILAQSLQEIQ